MATTSGSFDVLSDVLPQGEYGMENYTASGGNPYAAPSGDLSDVPKTQQLASLGARFGAAMIDGIILGLLTTVPLILIMGGWTGYITAAASASFLFKLGISALGFVAYTIVNGALLARDGQTVGKKLVGIKIVRADGSKVDLVRILTRRVAPLYLCQFIPFVGPFLLLIDYCLIFRSSRQCVHDQIADTIVIDA
jgi:uncharacterized RDD family membrane protein YckC